MSLLSRTNPKRKRGRATSFPRLSCLLLRVLTPSGLPGSVNEMVS